MNRRKARENALLLIFETEFNKECKADEVYDSAVECGQLEYDDYTDKLFYGVLKERENIDKKIEVFSNGWKLERISRITLAVMRVCVYEMLYCDDVPFAVAINEAVELAKKYDHEKAPAFVNGIVNRIAESEGLKAQ